MMDVAIKSKSTRLPDDWGAAQDVELIRAKGRYARIARLSDRYGVSERALVARWHRLRGAAPAAARMSTDKTAPPARIAATLPRAAKMSVEAVAEDLSKTNGAALLAIRDAGRSGATFSDLSEATGACLATLYSGLGRVERALLKTDWRIERETATQAGAPQRLRLIRQSGGAA